MCKQFQRSSLLEYAERGLKELLGLPLVCHSGLSRLAHGCVFSILTVEVFLLAVRLLYLRWVNLSIDSV